MTVAKPITQAEKENLLALHGLEERGAQPGEREREDGLAHDTEVLHIPTRQSLGWYDWSNPLEYYVETFNKWPQTRK